MPGKDKLSVVDYVYQTLYKKDRSQGVIMLEHELTSDSVGIFESYYPDLKTAGWQPHCIADLSNVDEDWYSNAENNGADADARSDVLPVPDSYAASSSTSSRATSASAASSSAASSAASSTSSASRSSSSSARASSTSSSSIVRASAEAGSSNGSPAFRKSLHSAAVLLGAGAVCLLL